MSVPANSECLIVGRSVFRGLDHPQLPSRARLNRANSISKTANLRAEALALAAKARAISESIIVPPPPTREQRIAEAQAFRRAVMR